MSVSRNRPEQSSRDASRRSYGARPPLGQERGSGRERAKSTEVTVSPKPDRSQRGHACSQRIPRDHTPPRGRFAASFADWFIWPQHPIAAAQLPPDLALNSFSYLSGTSFQLSASSGGGFLRVMLGQLAAYSRFSSTQRSASGSLSG